MSQSFLQSDKWSDFQKSFGRKVWRVGPILVIKYPLPFGKSYLYSPRSDFSNFNEEKLENFIKEIKRIAQKERAIFFRIEPIDKKFIKKLEQEGFGKGKDIQPNETIILDITLSEEKLLQRMHSKTRYNIRLAEKKGIEIKELNKKEGLEKFWQLLKQTTERDDFSSHPKNYYQKLLEIPRVKLFVALRKEEVLAANIVVFHGGQSSVSGGRAIYLHGASNYKYRNLMAPYLLQWHQIKEAKKAGCVEYDFWGISEKKWPGVTRFKRGFAPKSDPKGLGSGNEISYPGAYDLVFQKNWYWAYKIARKIL